MNSEELVIDFKPELPQLTVAKRQNKDTKSLYILNVFKGKEAIDIYEKLTRRK